MYCRIHCFEKLCKATLGPGVVYFCPKQYYKGPGMLLGLGLESALT